MTPALNLAAVALMLALIVAAYYVGKDAGQDEEIRRNATRRAHQIAANRPRTTTNNTKGK